MWALPALMALALLPTVKNTLSGVCLSFPVAHAIFAHRNTVLYHLDKVKRQTGLDPRRFYDLVELVKITQEVLESGS